MVPVPIRPRRYILERFSIFMMGFISRKREKVKSLTFCVSLPLSAFKISGGQVRVGDAYGVHGFVFRCGVGGD